MATSNTNYITQLPGTLNIEMTTENDLVFTITWSFDISTYTFTAFIIPKGAEDEIAMSVTNTDDYTATVTITATSIADLAPSINSWYMDWTKDTLTRTVLAGSFVLRAK